MDSGHNLKAESTGFAGGLDGDGVGEREQGEDSVKQCFSQH